MRLQGPAEEPPPQAPPKPSTAPFADQLKAGDEGLLAGVLFGSILGTAVLLVGMFVAVGRMRQKALEREAEEMKARQEALNEGDPLAGMAPDVEELRAQRATRADTLRKETSGGTRV